MSHENIISIIDSILNEAERCDLNIIEEERVPSEMLDASKEGYDGMKYWKSVPSTVTDNDLKEIEEKIGRELPFSYKAFLKHKHFCELLIDSASFMDHSIGKWKQALLNRMMDESNKQHLFDKGFIPFCNYDDWGLLCFDTKNAKENNEYPVVLWDMDAPTKVEELFPDFNSMITELGKRQQDLQNLW